MNWIAFPAVAFVVGLGIGGAGVYNYCGNKAKLDAANAAIAAANERERTQGQINAISSKYEAERARADLALGLRNDSVKDFYAAQRPSPDCGLPNPMYSLLDGATSSANAAASGQSGGAVPTFTPTPETNY